jgi:hypothetical protein
MTWLKNFVAEPACSAFVPKPVMSKHKNRVPVFLLGTPPVISPHFSTTAFSLTLIADAAARPINPKKLKQGIQLLHAETWASVKDRYRHITGTRPVPQLLPPGKPINLDLNYPEAYRQSNGAAIRRQVWSNFTANLQSETA